MITLSIPAPKGATRCKQFWILASTMLSVFPNVTISTQWKPGVGDWYLVHAPSRNRGLRAIRWLRRRLPKIDPTTERGAA